jgi:hypothetical protein
MSGYRTENEVERSGRRHSSSCGYPSEPCSCEVNNHEIRRTRHESWCNDPSGPCDCGLISRPA